MARSSDRLIIGVGGHVVALDTTTGDELWRTKLKSAAFTTIHADARRVYGGSGGEVFCLDAATGDILWRNTLKGLGLGVVAFPGSSPEVAAAAAALAAAAAS